MMNECERGGELGIPTPYLACFMSSDQVMFVLALVYCCFSFMQLAMDISILYKVCLLLISSLKR